MAYSEQPFFPLNPTAFDGMKFSLFDARTWEPVRSIPIHGPMYVDTDALDWSLLIVYSADASLSDDGTLLAVSNVVAGFDVYSAETGEIVCSLGHTVEELRKVPVLFIHDAAALLGGNPRGDVHLWDMHSGQKLYSLLHTSQFPLLSAEQIAKLQLAEGDEVLALAVRVKHIARSRN